MALDPHLQETNQCLHLTREFSAQSGLTSVPNSELYVGCVCCPGVLPESNFIANILLNIVPVKSRGGTKLSKYPDTNVRNKGSQKTRQI